jgi:hypothetical protein
MMRILTPADCPMVREPGEQEHITLLVDRMAAIAIFTPREDTYIPKHAAREDGYAPKHGYRWDS